jgi:hypothetical protein
LNAITKEAWTTAQNTEDKREKIQALSLAKDCYSMKMNLLTNATVVDDAIRFVSERQKEKLKSFTCNDNKESNEPDYDEDQNQLEEEQEEETGETTVNHVF